MADEARLHALLDLVAQARQEGDKETEQKAVAAYRAASAPPNPTTAEKIGKTLYDNPLIGAGELALQAASSIPTLVSKGMAGISGMLTHGRSGMAKTAKEIAAAPDMTYEPRSSSAKAVNQGLSKALEAWHQMALSRAQGPMSVGGNQPYLLAKTGIAAPVSPETPGQSEALGAAMDLVPQAAMAVAPATALTRSVGAAGRGVGGYFSPTVQAAKIMREVAGTPEQRAVQASALRSAAQPDLVAHDIPNSGQTAAQAVANIPEGTTIQALQQAVARRPDMGISVDFARRLAQQKAAIEAAKVERGQVTAPLREEALAKATNVDVPSLGDKVAGIINTPEINSVTPARNFLGSLSEQISKAQGARGLYGIRKYIDDLIEARVDSENNVAKGVMPQLRSMKVAIDDAIEQGGGGADWRKYLNTFATRSKAIDALEESTKKMYSPEQPTSVGPEGSMEGGTGAPHIFSRTASIANYGLGLRRHILEKAVNRQIADAALNPNKMADIISPGTGVAPPPPVAPAEPPMRFGPRLTLAPPPGRAYESHQPSVLRSGERMTQAESTQVPQDTLRLQPPGGQAFSAHQPELPFNEPLPPPIPAARGPNGEQIEARFPRPADYLPTIRSTALTAEETARAEHAARVIHALRNRR